MDELREYQGFAEGLAREAGGLLLEMADRGYRLKARRNLVTEADTASERLIAARIRAAWPDHGLLGEEGTRHPGGGRWTWVVDPLDGTTNYAHGLPAYSVALALVRVPPGRVEVAVVHAPRLGETYSARRGGGTLLNGAPVRVSDTERLGDALLASGFAYERNRTPDDNVANWGRLVMACRDLRRGGSASIDLACVAAGRHDGFWELHLAPWDKAPGSLLVEEAGGQVTDHEGGASWLEGPCIVATNGRVHEALRRELEPLRGPWPLAAPH